MEPWLGRRTRAAEPFLRDGGSGGGREVRAPGRLVIDVERLRHTVCTMLVCTGHGHAGARPPPRAATCRDVSQSICQSVSLSVSFPCPTWFLDVGVELLSIDCECEHNLVL